MLGKVDLDVGYDLQGVYKKEIDNYHFYVIVIQLFYISGGTPPTSGALVAMLKNHATQDLWCQPSCTLALSLPTQGFGTPLLLQNSRHLLVLISR